MTEACLSQRENLLIIFGLIALMLMQVLHAYERRIWRRLLVKENNDPPVYDPKEFDRS